MTVFWIVTLAYGSLIALFVAYRMLKFFLGTFKRSEPYEPEIGSKNPKTIVTLIHGTWASSAPWTSEKSVISSCLKETFPNDLMIHRFSWSGRNSITARQRASIELASKLNELTQRYPTAKHFVVGHSHGGTVTLNCLTPDLLQGISGIVCLATPVLVAHRRVYVPIAKDVIFVLPALFTLWAVLSVLSLLGISTEQISSDPPKMIVPLLGITTDPYRNLITFGSLAIGAVLSWKIYSWANSLKLPADFSFVPADRIIFVRAPGDEATELLGAVNLIGFVVDRLTAAPIRALWQVEKWLEDLRMRLGSHWIALGLIAFVAVFVACNIGPTNRLVSLLGAAALLGAGLTTAIFLAGKWQWEVLVHPVAAFVMIPMALLLPILGLVVGPEMIFASLLWKISAEVTPPGRWTVLNVGPRSSLEDNPGLQHSSLYGDKHVVGDICSWMLARSYQTN